MTRIGGGLKKGKRKEVKNRMQENPSTVLYHKMWCSERFFTQFVTICGYKLERSAHDYNRSRNEVSHIDTLR